jgi:hypothetical protein
MKTLDEGKRPSFVQEMVEESNVEGHSHRYVEEIELCVSCATAVSVLAEFAGDSGDVDEDKKAQCNSAMRVIGNEMRRRLQNLLTFVHEGIVKAPKPHQITDR